MESIQPASMPDLSENIFCSPAFVFTFKLPTKKEKGARAKSELGILICQAAKIYKTRIFKENETGTIFRDLVMTMMTAVTLHILGWVQG